MLLKWAESAHLGRQLDVSEPDVGICCTGTRVNILARLF